MAPLSGLLITEPKQGKTRTDSTYEWGNNGGKVSLCSARLPAREPPFPAN